MDVFGWLDNLPIWRDLPYPTKGALLRAIRAGASAFVGVLVAALAAGTLLPATTAPLIVLIVTMALQGLDKFLRESSADNEVPADTTITDNPDGT